MRSRWTRCPISYSPPTKQRPSSSATPSSSTLTCTFGDDTAAAQVILSAATTGQITTSTSSFGWRVLETLADEVVLELPPTAPEEKWAVTITLTKVLQADS
ncbi:hypothetical protein GCM10020255_014580 [Rhodococcus baikonurensis]